MTSDVAPDATKRRTLKVLLWSALGAGALTAGGVVVAFARSGASRDKPSTQTIARGDVPLPGYPPRLSDDGSFFLVHLAQDEGSYQPDPFAPPAAPGGLLAMRSLCTHLHCSVKWRDDLVDEHVRDVRGIFDCPCHGSRFTKAGLRVYGPAPRSLDTFRISATERDVTVHLDDVTKGGKDNTARAIRPPWTT